MKRKEIYLFALQFFTFENCNAEGKKTFFDTVRISLYAKFDKI